MTAWTKERIEEINRLLAVNAAFPSDMADAVEEISRLQTELAAEKESHRWIPVEERLPDTEGLYLVTGKYVNDTTKVFSCYFHGNSYRIYGKKSEWETSVKEITHWQPLPEEEEE